MKPGCVRGLFLLILLSLRLAASDWPQLLGPTRDGVYAGPAVAEQWPKEGPRTVWSVEVGEGYSSPVVSAGRVILSHRIATNLVVDCFDAKTGQRQWSFRHAMKFTDGAAQDNGPRPTPTIRQGKVFVHNTDGYLVCLDLQDGRKIWSRHAKSEFKSSATWHGMIASPFVTETSVILPVGATNAGIVAFSAVNGKTLWQAFDDKASASSPVLANVGGKDQMLVVTRSAFRGVDPETGTALWSMDTRKQSSGNLYAASPIVFGDKVFLSGWYKLGAQLVRLTGRQPELLWQRDDVLSTHYAAAIIHEDHLYGFHGHAWENGGPVLRCVDLATGKLRWEQPKSGSGTIVKCGSNLLIWTDAGELQLAKADPRKFQLLSRAQVLGRNTRSYPAVADGFVFVRGAKKLACLDLRAR
jgi:outer membrane protein assembly factor BamB